MNAAPMAALARSLGKAWEDYHAADQRSLCRAPDATEKHARAVAEIDFLEAAISSTSPACAADLLALVLVLRTEAATLAASLDGEADKDDAARSARIQGGLNKAVAYLLRTATWSQAEASLGDYMNPAERAST